ncbi:hypothetical protein MXB_4769, partial [Myxobolus squamalis]
YVCQESEYTFQNLKTIESTIPANMKFNRYHNILPYDHSRVKLSKSNDELTDYINANFIKLSFSSKSYIACQYPLTNTLNHFWQMIWEQNSRQILMLNKVGERRDPLMFSILIYIRYWPSQLLQKITYGMYEVTLYSEKYNDIFVSRKFELRKISSKIAHLAENKRTVHQIAYLTWPDFGVPESVDEFLCFVKEADHMWTDYKNSQIGPCIVHCSAGIGRTGTYILADVCLSHVCFFCNVR